ncbi:tape measure protein [Serratia bockelmannii]|uniref:Tape measure protein n=2 Tax=Serratia bockelmannii TaxID=2703793 RepID=A0ABT8LIK9_9GAMM|nr:tape measure protein [Serratia bockelmannii]MDN6877131.1 tape measure protein [Serratia bockelmannii]
MANETREGNILYQVEMDVQGLLVGQRQVNARLDEMEDRFNSTGKAVGSTEKAFSSLSRVAVSLSAALSVQQVAQYANAWVDVNNKLVNAVRPTEQLADVTQRVFDISQETRSGLEATATLYGRLERATRSAGTSTEDLAKLTTTINKGLVVSGATAEEASSTMIQLSQALASGVLRGEEFNSISENGSRLAMALADSLGVTVGQLRAMAAEGKLTTDVVVKGLLSQGDVIAKEFGKTTQTMSQSLQVAGNNLQKFFGESSAVQSGVSVFSSAIVTASENIDALSIALTVAAAVMGSRYVGALTMATAAKVKELAATRQAILAAADDAKASALQAASKLRVAEAAKVQALDEVRIAQLMRNSALTADALSAAEGRLSAARVGAATATENYNRALVANASAQATANTAARNASLGAGLLRNGLALLGGPAGAAMLAGSAIYYFYQSAQKAKQESMDFADKLDGLIGKMQKMSQTQLEAEIVNTARAIRGQSDAIDDQEAKVEALTKRVNDYKVSIKIYGESERSVRNLRDAQEELTLETEKLEEMERKNSRTKSALNLLQSQLNGTRREGIDLLRRDSEQTGIAADMMNHLGNAINFASRAKEKFNSQSLIVDRPKNIQDYLDKQQQQIELQSELNDRKRAQLKAEQDIRNLAGNDSADTASQERLEQDVILARERAGVEYDKSQAIKESNKATKEGIAEGKKSASQAESVAQKLVNLKQQSELAADSTSELSREQAILTAQQSLGKGATQAQIAEAGAYAAKKWDTANAIKAQVAAEKLLPEAKENASYAQDVKDLNTALAAKKISQEQYNTTAEQLEQQHQVNLAKIRAEAVVSPQQQAAGMVDPVQQLANENAQKLAMIQQFEANKTITEQQGLALRNAANTQYEQARIAAQWEIWKNQNEGNQMLAAGFESLAGNASNALTGIATDSMTAEEAAASLLRNGVNSLINGFVQMGIDWVKSAVMGSTAQTSAIAATTAAQVAGTATTTAASTAAAAATTTAWTPAAIVASIGSFGGAAAIGIGAVVAAMALSSSLAGKRKNGGPVRSGSMYQVGEGGLPEIYQASTGKQYMIPGDNGKVISNKQMTAGGSAAPTIIIENYSSGAGVMDTQASRGADGGDVVRIVLADLQQGGQISQGISRYHQAPRKATE